MQDERPNARGVSVAGVLSRCQLVRRAHDETRRLMTRAMQGDRLLEPIGGSQTSYRSSTAPL